MKIAIHHKAGDFSERWIECCKKNQISYKIVNCYDSDIISQVEDCDALMWHFHHADYKDCLFAKQLLFSLEQAGKVTFPDYNTMWHFDDKIGQKYLLEAIGTSLVPSYVFYSKKEALNWIDGTVFPKVFKLRGGAGSANVRLIKNRQNAVKIINKAFGSGFPQSDGFSNLKERVRKYREGKDSILSLVKGVVRLFVPSKFDKMHSPEKGYVYFQDFIPNNTSDIRVIVIGDKAFAIKRLTRKGDFRASGSGDIIYKKEEIPISCIQLAFQVNKDIQSQCIAYDFVFDETKPLLVEISYGFAVSAYDACPGYWDTDLVWHEGKFNPQEWMVNNLITSLE